MRENKEKPVAVFGAMGANLAIAVAKFVASAFTGSSAMLTEGIHSLVDTGNEVLLYIGIRRAERPPDDEHPFGHGMELYFWSLIVAVLLFGVGGGMSVYEGVLHVMNPSEKGNQAWNYTVLGISFVAEGISWGIAMREFQSHRGEGGFWKAFVASKDPSVYTVIAEDTAALTGLVIAFLGVFLSHWLEMPVLDGIASILIGTVLAGVAVFLVVQSKGLLIGESADEALIKDVRSCAERDPAVDHARRPLTIHLGPREVVVNLSLAFKNDLSANQVAQAVDRIEDSIRKAKPEVGMIFIEADAIKQDGAGHGR